MKKLMFSLAVAGLCGAVFADVEGANIVGYQNKSLSFYDSIEEEEMDAGYAFITPTFRNLDGAETSVQSIQLNEETSTEECFLQPMGYDGEFLDYEFAWLAKRDIKYYPHITLPAGANGVWVIVDDELTYRMPTEEEAVLEDGSMLQIVASTENTVLYNGQVSDDAVTYPLDFSAEEADSGYRYIGNPFPATATLQNFQMNAEASTEECFIDRLDGNGEWCPTEFAWLAKRDAKYYPHITIPDTANGAWVVYDDDLVYRMPTETENEVLAGDGFQITANDGSSVTILAPFEIK